MKRRALSLLLCLCLVLSLLPGTVFAAGQYDDIGGHWAESSIERWSDYRIVQGSDGHFRPNDPLTRGEMAAVLSNLLGLTDQGSGNPFADVPADAWYAPYVLRCYAAGIMQGDGGRANPTATITRQEAMVMLCRALAIPEKRNADLSAYSDGDGVASWARGAVAAMTEAKIVSGVGENQLAPAANINRASVVTILDRSIVQYINTPGTHTLTSRDGIVLVAAAGDVTLTGRTSADILVTPAGAGRTLHFDKATVSGAVTVQADNMTVTQSGSTLPEIVTAGSNITVETGEAAKPAARPSASGGSSGGSNRPSKASVSLSAVPTGGSGRLAVGDKLTAVVSNAGTARLVWSIGGFDQEITAVEYIVTAGDLGKEIFVKLVDAGGAVVAQSNAYTVSSSAELDTGAADAPVVPSSDAKLYKEVKDEQGNVRLEEVAVTEKDKLVLSIEEKTDVTEAEKTDAKTAVKSDVEAKVQETITALEIDVTLTDDDKAALAAATQVKAVDVDLTLVTQTTDTATGETKTEETPVHPVGSTTVRLSAAQLGMPGEDLNLYHFVASHTNKNGETQTIPGTVDAKGETVTFVTNGLSTIWIGNVPPRTVTFDTKGGSAVDSQRVRFGSTVDTGKVGTPTRDGYLFCGWNYDLAKTPIIYNMTVEAKWIAGTVVPVGRYTVTISPETASLTTEAANGKCTIQASPDAVYAAGITASAAVTPYENAAQYVVSAAADTAANTTDPAKFTQIGTAAITLTPAATVTDGNGKVVAGKTPYYIKWMDAAGSVLALEELVVVVDDGQGAAETKVVTRNINRGVGTYEPYLTSTAKPDAPVWMGYINGNPQRQYTNHSSEWEYYLRTDVSFREYFGSAEYEYKDYDVFHLTFKPFAGESYAGQSVSAQARYYDDDARQQVTVPAAAAVSASGGLEVSLSLSELNEPVTSSWINFTMQVTVGSVTQEIHVNTRNPAYQGNTYRDYESREAATMDELRAALDEAAAGTEKRWGIIYTTRGDVTLLEAMTVPANAELHISDGSLTVGDGGVLTMESKEDMASYLSVSGAGSVTVDDGGQLIALDVRTGRQSNNYTIGISAKQITVAGGGAVEVNPHTALGFYGAGSRSLYTLEAGAQLILSGSEDSHSRLDILDFDSVSLDGAVSVNGRSSFYVHSDSVLVGGTIRAGSSDWCSVEFYGDVTVLSAGSIRMSGSEASLDLLCPLTNKGTITLENGAYGILTNTGFVQYNSGTISIGSDCEVNLEGTKLVNTGTITGSGSIFAMLGDDLTDYAANHTGLEYVEVSGTQTPDNYSRYKFTGEPAKTIDVTLYKGDISNEQGGTIGSGIRVETEDFPAN